MGAAVPDGQPRRDPAETDPLQAFLAEVQRTPPHPTESKQDDAESPPAPPVEDRPDLTDRVERAERLLERMVIEMTGLKSDLATLVGAVDDIKNRQSRPAQLQVVTPAPPRRRASPVTAAVAAVMLAAIAFTTWGILSVASSDSDDPPSIETEVSGDVATPLPMTVATAPVEIQRAAAVSTVPSRDVPAPDDSRAEPREREAPVPAPVAREERRGAYVGTLTIDASPAGDVFLNRKNVGRTPVRLEKLRAGSHLVWIEREGYRRWTRVVPVAADRVSRVIADLDPLP